MSGESGDDLTIGDKEKNTTGNEALKGAFEKLLLVEEPWVDARPVELGVLERVVGLDILVEHTEGQHGLGRVEQVVHGDEEGLEERLWIGWTHK